MSDTPRTYKEAGVDVAAGEAFVDRIKPQVARTGRPEVLGGLGGFGGLFRLDTQRYSDPVLVAGTDGVGTKVKLAAEAGRHRAVGKDLVAMCINDLIVSGAEPLFFLDYYATGRLDPEAGEAVVAGIADGCAEAGCALLGGETAEMPGVYGEGDFDLAGFAVGVVDRDRLIDGSRIRRGDALIGLPASGIHSNGFSLVRHLLAERDADLDTPVGDTTLGEALLTPTRIYARALAALQAAVDVRAVAHITGGGLPGNLPRSLPEGMGAALDLGSWPEPAIFDWLRRTGPIAEDEMRATFNMGLGLVVAVPEKQAGAALSALEETGETGYEVGLVTTDPLEAVGFHD